MLFTSYKALAFASLALALPSPQISDPDPLIPSIPGVTVPLSENDPPLPILQPPTPPVPSPPWKGSNIRPKKIGYFWTGAGNEKYADFLAVYSLDDDTFGKFITLVDVPTSGNSPHHLGPSADGKTLYGGGLLSLLKTQDTGFYFDVSNPYKPTFKKSNRALLSSIADEVRAKPDGGFFITYMGSAVGTSPGRLVETDADDNIIHQWPEDTQGVLSILKDNFNPHGLTINFEKQIGLTSDFVVPLSILKPTMGKVSDNTLRLWDMNTRTIINKITIPGGGGIQDVKFIPGNKETAALATAVSLGQVWIIYPYRKNADGSQGVAKLFYDLGPNAVNKTAIYSDITQNGKFAYFTITDGNHVAALDISNVNKPKRLDNPNLSQGIVGPHYIKVAPDQKHLLVTDYFIQPGPISIVNSAADFKAQWIDINPDGSLHFNRSIPFAEQFTSGITNRGGAKPHSAVIFDLTDPKNPKYY